MTDEETLDKMEKDLHNLARNYDVHNNAAAKHLRDAAKEIRQARDGLKGTYSPPDPEESFRSKMFDPKRPTYRPTKRESDDEVVAYCPRVRRAGVRETGRVGSAL